MSKLYRVFSVGGNPDHAAFLSTELSNEISHLQNNGWDIESVNINHIHKAWSSNKQKYFPTDEYIIICSVDREK